MLTMVILKAAALRCGLCSLITDRLRAAVVLSAILSHESLETCSGKPIVVVNSV